MIVFAVQNERERLQKLRSFWFKRKKEEYLCVLLSLYRAAMIDRERSTMTRINRFRSCHYRRTRRRRYFSVCTARTEKSCAITRSVLSARGLGGGSS